MRALLQHVWCRNWLKPNKFVFSLFFRNTPECTSCGICTTSSTFSSREHHKRWRWHIWVHHRCAAWSGFWELSLIFEFLGSLGSTCWLEINFKASIYLKILDWTSKMIKSQKVLIKTQFSPLNYKNKSQNPQFPFCWKFTRVENGIRGDEFPLSLPSTFQSTPQSHQLNYQRLLLLIAVSTNVTIEPFWLIIKYSWEWGTQLTVLIA